MRGAVYTAVTRDVLQSEDNGANYKTSGITESYWDRDPLYPYHSDNEGDCHMIVDNVSSKRQRRPRCCGTASTWRRKIFSGHRLPFLCMVLVIVLVGLLLASILVCQIHCYCDGNNEAEHPPCPDDWIWVKGHCYYFSDSSDVWETSRHFCSKHYAALVILRDQETVNIIQRYKEKYLYWVGLQKKENGQWFWLDGTEYTKRFAMEGAGRDCAVLDADLETLDCSTPRHWICRKDTERFHRTDS